MIRTVSIAGHTLSLDCPNEEISRLLTEFLVPADPAVPVGETEPLSISVTIGPADMAAERAQFDVAISDAHAAWLALERAAARALAPFGVLHMHAVALAVDHGGTREACVFLAGSGEGKSTHVRRWLHLLGSSAVVVADDKPFLSFAGDTLRVHGSPWRGKEGWGGNLSVPVRCFCMLRRGDQDTIRRADTTEVMQEVFRRTLLPEDPSAAVAVLSVVDKMLRSVPFWCLSCTDTAHAAEVAYNALFERM